MRHRHLAAAVAAFIGFYGAAVPTAQAAIVTTPSGLRAGGSVLGTCIASNDPTGTALWRRTSVTCPTTSTGITTDYPRSGGGSAWLNSAVTAGKADFAMAGMTVTDERKQSVDFTDSYVTARQVVIVKG